MSSINLTILSLSIITYVIILISVSLTLSSASNSKFLPMLIMPILGFIFINIFHFQIKVYAKEQLPAYQITNIGIWPHKLEFKHIQSTETFYIDCPKNTIKECIDGKSLKK